MEIKNNVRNRRHDRIKTIQNRIPLAYEQDDLSYYDKDGYRGVDSQPQQIVNDPQSVEARRWVPTRGQIWTRLIISAIVFAGLWGLFQRHEPWAEKSKQFVRETFHRDIQFQAVAAWYEDTFSGTPSFIPAFFHLKGQEVKKVDAQGMKGFISPLHGKVVETFSISHQWIVLQAMKDSQVRAMDTGRVVYTGHREDTGNTVVIQHVNGYQSTYGKLQTIQLERNDWVQAGDVIGKVSTGAGQAKGELYFAIMKDALYLNPADVVTFD